MFNIMAPELFFLILAHIVYKTWIIQEANTLELWNKLHFEEKKQRVYTMFNIMTPELFFLILAHIVYKTWIIQEPNTLELWNKLHFEDKKRRVYTPYSAFSEELFTYVFVVISSCLLFTRVDRNVKTRYKETQSVWM